MRGSAAVGQPSTWPFVGRGEELAYFRSVLADPASRGVLICGPSGVGKTRLADEFLTEAAAHRRVGRATGSTAAAQMPLGALAHLLPMTPGEAGDTRLDPIGLFNAVAAGFRDNADGGPFVLLADDIHLLDITSLTLLTQLIDAAAVFVLGTVRTGEPVPDAVWTMWRSGRVARIDLTELSPEGIEQLLPAVLGGPVEAGTVADFYSIGRGNILFLRELTLGALRSGRLVNEHGVWRLTGSLTSTPPLVDLVETRLRSIDAPARQVLELLALVGMAGLSELTAKVDTETLEHLERAGLVRLMGDGRRLQVSLTHPLYGEVLRDQLPVLTRRRVLLEQAERVQAYGARRRGDALRVATWRLDVDGTADPRLLLDGARLARYGHDFRQVRRLASAALPALADGSADDSTIVDGQLMLGEANYELGLFAEADRVLAEAEGRAADAADLVQIVSTRGRNLTYGLLQPDGALEVIRSARSRIDDAGLANELLAVEARILGHAARPAEALRVLEPLGAADDLRTQVLRAVPLATALTLSGRCEDGLQAARHGFDQQASLGDQVAMVHPSTHLVIEVFALAESGRIAEATERATSGRRLAVQDRSTIGRIWFAYHLGRCALLTGRVRTARRWYAEAVTLCRDHGYPWPLRLTATSLAAAAAAMGDTAAARQALREADSVGDIGYLRAEQEIGPAWTAAAEGDLAGARAILLEAAEAAIASEQLSSAAWLLHDVVRLGAPAGVRASLARIAARSQGRLVAAYARHAEAAATNDPEALVAAVDEFQALGAMLLAAEAAVAAGHAYQKRGRARASARLRSLGTTLAQRCEGARTPGLVTTASVTPLTRREREIALLAADGVASKDIASRLHLSVRTVDNHLQNAYTKLGLTNRADLAAALSTDPGPVE